MCNTCKEFTICYKEDIEDDYEYFSDFCDCTTKKKFIRQEKIKNPEFFLRLIAMDLENANHHRQSGLADNLYNKITKKLILDEKQKLDISKILYKCFYDSI